MNGNSQINEWSCIIYNICFNTDESQAHFFSPSDWMLIIWPFSQEQSVAACDLLQEELVLCLTTPLITPEARSLSSVGHQPSYDCGAGFALI